MGQAWLDKVIDALTEKYGAPTKDEATTVENRMGAKFDSRVAVWSLTDGNIVARRRGADLEYGDVTFTATGYAERAAAAQHEAAKAATSKLQRKPR